MSVEDRGILARPPAMNQSTRRRYPLDEENGCTGMDVPIGPWGDEEVAFWTGTARYQPWKDVSSFFKCQERRQAAAMERAAKGE